MGRSCMKHCLGGDPQELFGILCPSRGTITHLEPFFVEFLDGLQIFSWGEGKPSVCGESFPPSSSPLDRTLTLVTKARV